MTLTPEQLAEIEARADRDGTINLYSSVLALLASHRELEAMVEELTNSLKSLHSAITELVEESTGVYGLHLEGAPWDTLLPGGFFEEWLLPMSSAEETLAKVAAMKGGSR